MNTVNETHDIGLHSWVESANLPGADFPVQNLPFGAFRRRGGTHEPRIGVAIGDRVVDVAAALDAGCFTKAGLLAEAAAGACRGATLNALIALGPDAWHALRLALSRLLRVGAENLRPDGPTAARILVAMSDVDLLLPLEIGDYTDFYASVHHATNIGTMLRPDQPLMPNYKWIPIGYHGRASSVGVSGMPVRRPVGQFAPAAAGAAPTVGPSQRLDYELEVGAIIGTGNAQGTPVRIGEAAQHLFGFVLLNDWSARDVQGWEYQPLGPFLSKSFATTISPWVVTQEAFAPFRAPAFTRAEGDPAPLPYLADARDQAMGNLDLMLEVLIQTPKMAAAREAPARVSLGNARELYWTFAQMVAHHTMNGCNLRVGDLLGSGTVSGPTPESRGCLMERTWRGAEPLTLPNGETRTFLADGDTLVMRGWCERDGRRIGLGEVRGTVLPASEG
jgi:fumarylacetoacetase